MTNKVHKARQANEFEKQIDSSYKYFCVLVWGIGLRFILRESMPSQSHTLPFLSRAITFSDTCFA